MNTRRDFLRLTALAPLALVPEHNDLQVSQSAKSFIERAKYLDYTENDFYQCKLILRDEAGNKLRTRPFNKVVLSKDPFKGVMKVDYHSPPIGIQLVSCQFVDKEGRCLFTPSSMYTPIITDRGEILHLTYTLRLD